MKCGGDGGGDATKKNNTIPTSCNDHRDKTTCMVSNMAQNR